MSILVPIFLSFKKPILYGGARATVASAQQSKAGCVKSTLRKNKSKSKLTFKWLGYGYEESLNNLETTPQHEGEADETLGFTSNATPN